MIDSSIKLITRYGYDLLINKLNDMRNKSKRVTESIVSAKARGDFSENEEYKIAKSDKATLDHKMPELERYLDAAIIVSDVKFNCIVSFGLKVELVKNEKIFLSYIILGSKEAEIDKGSIGIHVPLTKAMMGKRVGATFEFNGAKYRVSQISIPEDHEIRAAISIDQ